MHLPLPHLYHNFLSVLVNPILPPSCTYINLLVAKMTTFANRPFALERRPSCECLSSSFGRQRMEQCSRSDQHVGKIGPARRCVGAVNAGALQESPGNLRRRMPSAQVFDRYSTASNNCTGT